MKESGLIFSLMHLSRRPTCIVDCINRCLRTQHSGNSPGLELQLPRGTKKHCLCGAAVAQVYITGSGGVLDFTCTPQMFGCEKVSRSFLLCDLCTILFPPARGCLLVSSLTSKETSVGRGIVRISLNETLHSLKPVKFRLECLECDYLICSIRNKSRPWGCGTFTAFPC